MPGQLTITADWERLDEGSPEERACFGAIGIRWNDVSLTEGRDSFVNVVRNAPFLSGYHLAEWVVWNWWRLRWEPRSANPDWAFAHRMNTIGGGYVWPNITVFSDGERTALVARPTEPEENASFRYIADATAVMAADDFEEEVDRFVGMVLEKLRVEEVQQSNLRVLWNDLLAERRNPELAHRRKLEALLGREPDEADAAVLDRLETDSRDLGETAVDELAAHHDGEASVLFAADLRQIAERNGFDASPASAFRFEDGGALPRHGEVAAWKLGAEAAKAVREQAGLEERPIADQRLADLVGVVSEALDQPRTADSRIAFSLDDGSNGSRVVFRSNWKTGRRFELGRLLGDRLVFGSESRLFPATRSHTYRQKMQRSFAAELLSPFEAVTSDLRGDLSDEAQQEVAEKFQVSPLTIRTQLVNNGYLAREELEQDFDHAA